MIIKIFYEHDIVQIGLIKFLNKQLENQFMIVIHYLMELKQVVIELDYELKNMLQNDKFLELNDETT